MRLIDADRLIEEFVELFKDEDRYGYVNYGEFREVVDSQPLVNEWIPVSERLPEVDRCVLFCTKDGNVAEGVYETLEWTQFRWQARISNKDVIAWMSLPDAYEGDNDEVN